MGRTNFLLEVMRARNGVAVASLIALLIVCRILGIRKSTWIVVRINTPIHPAWGALTAAVEAEPFLSPFSQL